MQIPGQQIESLIFSFTITGALPRVVFSDEQRRVGGHLLSGLSVREVVARLRMSPGRVRQIRREIMRRLGARSNADLKALGRPYFG